VGFSFSVIYEKEKEKHIFLTGELDLKAKTSSLM
jgi:hypothetical protein